MKRITSAELAGIIEVLPGAQPMTMKTRTVVDLKKTGNPFGQVVKFSHVNGMVGVNYENAVNRQQVREGAEHGDFEAQAPKWGTRVGKKLITHKGNWYCPIKVQTVLTPPTYMEASTLAPLTVEDIKPWMSAPKSNAAHQGVEKEIFWRTYNLDSILEMTIGGETYEIVKENVVEAAVEATTTPAPVQDTIAAQGAIQQ